MHRTVTIVRTHLLICHHYTVENGGDAIANCNWCAQNGSQEIEKRMGVVNIKEKNRDHPDVNTANIR